MLESSKALFPYELDDQTIIFKDELGNELLGVTNVYSSDDIDNYTFTFAGISCIDDSEKKVDVELKPEALFTYLIFQELEISFDIAFRASVNVEEYEEEVLQDICRVYFLNGVGDPDFTSPSNRKPLSITINQRNDPRLLESSEPISTIEINSKEFTSVYIKTDDELTFYYNHEYGIVGIIDNKSDKVYSFDRYE